MRVFIYPQFYFLRYLHNPNNKRSIYEGYEFLQYNDQHLSIVIFRLDLKSKIMIYIMSYDSMIYGME